MSALTGSKDYSHPGDASNGEKASFGESVHEVYILHAIRYPTQPQGNEMCVYTDRFLSCFSLVGSRLYSVQTSETL